MALPLCSGAICVCSASTDCAYSGVWRRAGMWLVAWMLMLLAAASMTA